MSNIFIKKMQACHRPDMGGYSMLKGDFFVFLDADDWLLKTALEINVGFLNSSANAAFVAGGFELYHESENKTWVIQQEKKGNYYHELLKGNFIGMHATVMYRASVFEHFSYNTSLRYCEDYDLYLQITRLFPIIYHTQLPLLYIESITAICRLIFPGC